MTTQDGTGAPPAAQRRGLSRWWYLVYLGTLVFQPAFDPDATDLDWVVVAVLLAVGAALYAVGELRDGRPRLGATIAFAVLGAMGVWVNTGASVFFVYAAAFAGTFAPRHRAQRWLVALTAALVLLALLSPVPLPFRFAAFGFPLVFVWVIGHQVMDDAEREREWARLRVDNARIERLATLGERERLARDLHDLLGHTLTGIVVRAQLVQRLAGGDPDRVAAEAGDIEGIAREALTEVRAAVSGWRHHALDAELDAAQASLAAADVDLSVRRDTDVELSPRIEAALALAVREAVTNVVRHARATRCDITVAADGGHALLVVCDDGVGAATATEGSGLLGMRERVGALGGHVDRHSDRGTRLTVRVPLVVPA